MVLTTRRFFDQTYDATTFAGANGPTILAKASACQIVGLIQQLGELSEFASDIYHALSRDTFNAAKRIDRLSDRVTSLEGNLGIIDAQLKQMPPAVFFDTTVDTIWRRSDNMAHTFFSEDTRPLPLVRLVNETFAPPAIHLLNEFAGKDCTALYSDPAFFFNQWVEEQAKKFAEENEANKQRRRKNRRKRKAADPVEVQGIEVKVYDARGKEFSDLPPQQQQQLQQQRRVQLEPSRSLLASPSNSQIRHQQQQQQQQVESPLHHHHQTIEPHTPLAQTPSNSMTRTTSVEYGNIAPPPSMLESSQSLDLAPPPPTSMGIDDIFQQKMSTNTTQIAALAAPSPPHQQSYQQPPPPQQSYQQPPPPQHSYQQPPPPQQPQYDSYEAIPSPTNPAVVMPPPPREDYSHIPPPVHTMAQSPPASLHSPISSPPPPAHATKVASPMAAGPGHLPPPPHAGMGGPSAVLRPPPPSVSPQSSLTAESSVSPTQSPRPGGHLPPPPTSNILKPVDTSEPVSPRPQNPMMAGRGDLLSALRGGVGLRKVDDSEKAADAPAAAAGGGGGGLLDAIRNRPMLRKASVLEAPAASAPQPRGPAQLSAVMELLERRKVIHDSDDDDDFSDDDDWD